MRAAARAIGVLAPLGTSCSSDDDTSESEPVAVVIDMATDVSTQVSVGNFSVAEGADVVGCSAGRFYNTPLDDGTVRSTLTCQSGLGEGDVRVLFEPTLLTGQEDQFDGPWSFTTGTGDFVELEGGGELSALRDATAKTIDLTLTGEIAVAGSSEATSADD